jgi:hypothetical protein
MNSKSRGTMRNLAWTLGACGVLWLAGAGSAFAGIVPEVPELDPGSAVGGIALAIGAAVLLVERYRRRA